MSGVIHWQDEEAETKELTGPNNQLTPIALILFLLCTCTPTLNTQLTIDTTYQLRTSYTHTYQPLYLIIIFCNPPLLPQMNQTSYLYPFIFTTIQCNVSILRMKKKLHLTYPQSQLIQLNLIYYHAQNVVIQTFIFHFCTKHTSLLSSSKM